MLTTTPHLSTHRPSSTTISFTVSTAPPLPTLPLRILSSLTLLLRITLGLATLLFVVAKTRSSFSAEHETGITSLERLFWASETGVRCVQVAQMLDWRVVIPLALGSLVLVFRRFHTGMTSFFPCIAPH